VCGAWCVVHGAWCVVRGVWCVVGGAWCVVGGAWCVVRGVPYVEPHRTSSNLVEGPYMAGTSTRSNAGNRKVARLWHHADLSHIYRLT